MKTEKLKLLLNYPTSSNTLKERLELLLPKKKQTLKRRKHRRRKTHKKHRKHRKHNKKKYKKKKN